MSLNGSPNESHRPLSGHGSRIERKTGMSCAECRRSKLKCDRTFPCSACVRRGCASICPDGILAATKGNKVLQMQNEQQMSSIKRMTSRIKELEAALAETQSQVSPQPHPLLKDGKKLKDADVDFLLDGGSSRSGRPTDEASNLIGSLSIGEQGQSRFHGQSSASEFLQTLLPNSDDTTGHIMHSNDLDEMGFSAGVIDLVNAFPFRTISPDPNAKSEILEFIPEPPSLLSLSLSYFENVTCPYRVIKQESFVPWLLEIRRQPLTGSTIGDDLHSHQLALVFLVLATGSLLSDEEDRDATGEKYYHLACAALSLNPITEEASSTTLQALFVMIHYFNCRDSPRSEQRWLLGGIMFRLSYSLGLQRDPSLWKLNLEETQRRRRLFWELYSWDAWNSITYGRPPSLNISYTDCRFPEDDSPVTNAKGEKEMGFDAFKYRLAAFVLAPVLNHIFSVREPNYSALLEIDIKLRKLSPPSWLLSPTRGKGEPVDNRSWNANSALAMQQYCLVCVRESTLLYIHRRYFATAIKLNKDDPLKTKYGASVMAACRSACLLLSSLRSLYGAHPQLASRQTFFWSGAFSAVIVLCCLVYNSPHCSLASDAVQAIDDGVDLYSMRLFEDTSSSVKLLTSVRQAVHNIFNRCDTIKNGREANVEHDEKQCPMMRILEGNTSLINLGDFKSIVGDGSLPSASSSSSSSSQPQSRFPSEELDSSPHIARGSPESPYAPEGSMTDASLSPDYKMLDFAGSQFSGVEPHTRSLAQKASPLSGYSTTSVNMGDLSTHSTPNFMADGKGPSIYTQDQTFTKGIEDSGHSPMDDVSFPPYMGPGIQYANDFGASAAGIPAGGMYDQANWERFLGEMGIENHQHIAREMV